MSTHGSHGTHGSSTKQTNQTLFGIGAAIVAVILLIAVVKIFFFSGSSSSNKEPNGRSTKTTRWIPEDQIIKYNGTDWTSFNVTPGYHIHYLEATTPYARRRRDETSVVVYGEVGENTTGRMPSGTGNARQEIKSSNGESGSIRIHYEPMN